ncbi:MAG: hypothetical protein O2868_11990 [Proteobacteria bacterium]|jgi:hypothetical protein|nr:hypothetical protein [Pseudomonadota bacterium]
MGVLTPYVAGTGVGLILTTALSRTPDDWIESAGRWVDLNLGYSAWVFVAVLVCFVANLISLRGQLRVGNDFKAVSRLDQLSDVWTHVFVGVGVIWTAVGMRSALSAALTAPADVNEAGSQVLARLVDGGILLALSTTIVGAAGGYLMRLLKTGWLGAALSAFYHHEDRYETDELMARLRSIEDAITRYGTRPVPPSDSSDFREDLRADLREDLPSGIPSRMMQESVSAS